jgi:7-cyano-7-deazaguanine synthase in queuosine biosynthesis
MTDNAGMARPHVMVMTSGGVRSLVALAMVRAEPEPQRVSVVHVLDGRPAGLACSEAVRRQAEAYEVNRVVEVELPLQGESEADGGLGGPPLATAQLLLSAADRALATQAVRLVWPVSCRGRQGQVGRISEQALLVEHLADTHAAATGAADGAPRIDTPLLDLSDRQVLELGQQLEVDWTLAWSCEQPQELPCRACGGCRRRAEAFTAAKLGDPLLKPLAVSR